MPLYNVLHSLGNQVMGKLGGFMVATLCGLVCFGLALDFCYAYWYIIVGNPKKMIE